ncbi:P-loop containing nucleoside triphosphate hydrolase protein, partial [Kalaharituber pfeilii]
VEAKYVFQGMPLSGIDYKGVKRDFRVESIDDAPVSGKGSPKADTSSLLSSQERKLLSAYKTSSTTTVTLISTSNSAPTNGTSSPAKPSNFLASSNSLTDLPPTPTPAPPFPTFAQIGGLDSQLSKLKALLLATLRHSHHFASMNLTPFRGILLYGPPGTGKSLIMRCIPGEFAPHLSPQTLNTYQISGSVVGKYLGESEASIRKIFKEAKSNQPSIIFIDEVDSIAPKRAGLGGDPSEGRVVATLMTELDELGEGGTVVVAATNRPNGVDEGLRRPGRLEREIEVSRPDAGAREQILNLLLRKVRKGWLEQSPNPIIKSWASRTHGFVGADLEALVRAGVLTALTRLTTSTDPTAPLTLHIADIDLALKDIRPTAMREVFLETPNVRWTDIGGQEEVKQRLREAVEWPLTNPEVFSRLGGTPRKGLLLYGPPGCSKTLTAKALATEAGLNFMPVKGPELLNMYVGESERAVREVFRKARAASPSIIFFDEIDALGSNRGGGGLGSRENGGGNGVNVLTALLNEMDGIETLRGVVVLAATNRPEIIDPALLRPGRLDTILYVPPPNLPARLSILRIKTSKMPLAPDVDLSVLAEQTDGHSGAEIVHICDEAVHCAMRESMEIQEVAKRHFDEACGKATRQITEEMRRFYEEWSVGGVRKI